MNKLIKGTATSNVSNLTLLCGENFVLGLPLTLLSDEASSLHSLLLGMHDKLLEQGRKKFGLRAKFSKIAHARALTTSPD